MNTHNFTFEATIGDGAAEGEGNVGSIDGQQPIEVIIENSSLVAFQDMSVESVNGECSLAACASLSPCIYL